MDLRSFFNFKKLDGLDPRHYRVAIASLASLVVLMGLSGLIAFFLALRGDEQTLVPNVVDMELSAALVKLQEKELYPRISLRFSSEPETRGRILEQDPLPGAIVKAGRRIALVVSRGAAQEKVGDYVGQTVDEVKIHLQTVFGSTRQLITVKEPPVFVYDQSPAGTILEQDPAPNVDLSGPTQLTFVVSRGPEKAKVKVPDLVGLSLQDAALQIEKSGVAFQFAMRPVEGRERPGTVVAQLPVPGTLEDPSNPVSIVFGAPAASEGVVVGLFSQPLPEYPYPLRTVLYAEPPTGARVPLISVDHSGRSFTMPYALPEGSVLVLQVLNKVVARVEAGR
ncbi:MAG: PASTA domain-containing protein [Spirochaetes bacterium]|nr:PASTA domain-containing protein [Spirochaetota bacterium]MBU1081761.1 PASTA domain-containing protein [Spirochaetota bacterium]